MAPEARRILMVVHDIWAKGGMEVQLIHLAKGLAARGHQVVVVSETSGAEPADDSPLTRAGVAVVHLAATTRARKLASLRRLAGLARGADLVHCTDFDATLWGRLAAMLTRTPVVVSHHSLMRELQVSRTGASRSGVIALHNQLLDPFTTMTVACARCQIPLLEREGVKPAKLMHIPNGVPVDELRAKARAGVTRESLGIPADARVIAHVGRVNPQKGQLLTLETVARLRDAVGDVHVVFAGTGPDLPKLRSRAEELSASGWAHILGFESNVGAVFALADLGVLPSEAEAMPMVVLEALAVGVPMVTTDVGDLPFMLEGTGAGLCVGVGDGEAFFEACRAVLQSPEREAELRARANEAGAEIDAGTMTDRYAAAFAAAVGGRFRTTQSDARATSQAAAPARSSAA